MKSANWPIPLIIWPSSWTTVNNPEALVSDVAHELRTPLTIIQGTVDGIEDGVFSPDKEHLDSIKEQTRYSPIWLTIYGTFLWLNPANSN